MRRCEVLGVTPEHLAHDVQTPLVQVSFEAQGGPPPQPSEQRQTASISPVLLQPWSRCPYTHAVELKYMAAHSPPNLAHVARQLLSLVNLALNSQKPVGVPQSW